MTDRLMIIEDFKDHVGSVFTVTYPDIAPIVLTLDEAKPMTNYNQNAKREPFSLTFGGPGDVMLSQQMHRLKHDKMGDLDIFLVPVAKNERGYLYQAVFN